MQSSHGELKKIKELFESVYLIADPYIIKTLIASVINQRISGDSVWIVFVGASGEGKSEFINSIAKCVGVWPLSTLTSHTFISGQSKTSTETSLLLRIQNGIITFKDLTSLLSENREERAMIMAQLREIYDGKMNKSFGNGRDINWEGKITVIAASTYAIHSLKQQYTAMGERFLFYNIISPDREEATRRAMRNQSSGNLKEQRLNIETAVGEYVNNKFQIPNETPKISEDVETQLIHLAELSTRARSDVERNFRSPAMEILEVYKPEMPTRFAGQLQGYANSLMIINWNEMGKLELLKEDEEILYKISLDSVNKSRRTAMQELSKYDIIETSGLATKLNMPTNTVRRWLEDLCALEICDRVKGKGSKGDRWTIKEKYRQLICKFENISKEGEELIEKIETNGIISEEDINEAM